MQGQQRLSLWARRRRTCDISEVDIVHEAYGLCVPWPPPRPRSSRYEYRMIWPSEAIHSARLAQGRRGGKGATGRPL